MRILLIGCEVIIRELCDAVARSPREEWVRLDNYCDRTQESQLAQRVTSSIGHELAHTQTSYIRTTVVSDRDV